MVPEAHRSLLQASGQGDHPHSRVRPSGSARGIRTKENPSGGEELNLKIP